MKTDPRKVLIALATVLGMLAIYAVGMHARHARFEAAGVELEQPFWMESAQRYRYVEMVATGEGIPELDRRMWAPEGYDPRIDTILQERFYGAAYRVLGMSEEVPLRGFVRIFTRYVYCAGIFALVALSGVLRNNRLAALLACMAYAVILPAVERSTGQVLYREHLAIPLVVFHLYFLASALDKRRTVDAWVAGLFLVLAMSAWKLMTFYFVIQAMFFVLAVLRGNVRRILPALTACTVLPIATSLVWPSHLHFDRFHFGLGALLAATTLAVALVHHHRPIPWWVRILGIAGGTALLLVLLPGAHSYGHAWETILARVVHLGNKPADPAELTFHARHFWSGNYRSPTLERALRDFGIPVLVAVPGLVGEVRRVWRERAFDAHAQLLFLFAAMLVAYLLFRKLQAFPAMLVAVYIGIGWTQLAGKRQAILRGALVVGVALMVLQTYGKLPGPHRLLAAPEANRYAAPVTHVHTGDDLARLIHWIETHTGPDDILLADFVLSPYLLEQTERPVVLNCFFESPMVERYRRYTEALFADEASFHDFCEEHQVDWVIHTAHQTLRTDDEMSYRYAAAAGDWQPGWPAAMFQYQPDGLQHFQLHLETPFFRVYRSLGSGQVASTPAADGQVLFSRAVANAEFGDPGDVGWPRRGDPAAMLYRQVRTLTNVSLARRALEFTDDESAAAVAEELLWSAAEVSPLEPSTYRELAPLAAAAGDMDRASGLTDHARNLEFALAGDGPLPGRVRD